MPAERLDEARALARSSIDALRDEHGVITLRTTMRLTVAARG